MNGDSSQTSEPTPVEVTKKGIRINIWKQMQKNQGIRVPYHSYNHIPWLTGAEDPIAKLKELDVFKNANNVLVSYDKAQESVKLACLQAKKTLYVQVPRLQKYLMTCLKMKDDATEQNLLDALTLKGLEEFGVVVGLNEQVPIDLVVIGSIAVTKNGVRIGKGGGYVDLYLAVLTHLKLIQPSTIILTTVHDSQILNSVPANIIGPHDFPVDIIVTPTQIIHTKREKPSGIMWNLISQRQLNDNQLLAQIRDKEIESGNECVLKTVDSDADRDGENTNHRRYYRGRWGGNNKRWQGSRYRKQPPNGVHSESEPYEGAEGETANANNKPERGYRRSFYPRRRHISNKGKSSFRDKTWYSLRSNRASTTPRFPYFRIPGFRGSQEASQLLREQEVFKKAKHVLVSTEQIHKGIRLACLEDGKNLYVLNPKLEKDLLIRVDMPEEDNEKKTDLKNVANRQGIEEFGVKLDLSEPLTIDLWVVGSVAISKDGYHIGKGNGSLDLYYGYLVDKKIISSETTIVTTVHDQQVFDTLPAEIFSDHDIPVDEIVTPTQVIKIEHERKPPTGVLWNLINERLLARLPFLSEFREKEILAGKPCVLKEDGPDDNRKKRSNDLSESEHNETEGETGNRNRKKRMGPPVWRRFHRRNPHDNENEESGNISPDTTSRPNRRIQFRHPKPPKGFSIKLTSIDRTARVRDLKAALNDRNVKPNFIAWKGNKGYCYLHFAKPATPTGAEGDTDLSPDSILGALADLTLQPTPDLSEDCAQVPPNKVSVELVKPLARIETADETAV